MAYTFANSAFEPVFLEVAFVKENLVASLPLVRNLNPYLNFCIAKYL
jgi:hypothetical protein